MKRFFNITFAVLAGAMLLGSCAKDTLVTFDPALGKDQTLGGIQGCTLDADAASIETFYVEADFGVNVPVAYTLYVAESGANMIERKLNATIADGKITIKQKDLNTAILNMGGVADTEFSVDFQLVANMLNDKGAAIDVEGATKKSNVVTATFIPYDVEILDVDAYEHVWIIGSGASVGAWSHGNVYQYLYDYNKSGHVYTGMIYYGDDAASGWKLTGIADWDDSCNWGSENQDEAEEPASVQLVTGGGSKDIKCYSKKYYMWSFDKTSMVLTKQFGCNSVAITGSFQGWEPADGNCIMAYNDYYHRFYIDWEFSEDAQLKFTADGSWDLNWGVGLVNGGDNIPVAAGKYRVYLDFNKGEYEFNAAKYGTEEPGAPEKEPDHVWSVIGTVNGSNWDTDVYMSEKESGVWSVQIKLTDTDEFKLRYEQNWSVSLGGPEENAESKIDPANPYGVFQPTLGEPFAAGDKNIMVGEAGNFEIVYDANKNELTVNKGASGWALIGVNGDWNTDIEMRELSTGVWVSKGLVETDGRSFKLRYNCEWADNRGGVFEALGAQFAAVPDGSDIELPAGKYFVVYNPMLETITVNPGDWSVIGGWEGTSWDTDLFLAPVAENVYVSETFNFGSNDNGVKVRKDGGWAVSFGAPSDDYVALGTPFTGSSNIKVTTPEVPYALQFDAVTEEITMFRAFGIIGEVNGTSWSTDYVMTYVGNSEWVGAAVVDGGFKIRECGNWDVNFGGTCSALDTEFEAAPGGDDISVPETGKKYKVVLNTEKNTIVVSAL
ncbi:MAG: SusE domain-containing protein [Bacteroidales bacterium]|nr:SusE domain-containing protein [Bacteroidales bacterium]